MSPNADLRFCEARPEFMMLSEHEVWDAIGIDAFGENPITGEVTRLGAEFMSRFRVYADAHGGPPGIMRVDVQCPIERVAILMMLCYVESRSGVRSFTCH